MSNTLILICFSIYFVLNIWRYFCNFARSRAESSIFYPHLSYLHRGGGAYIRICSKHWIHKYISTINHSVWCLLLRNRLFIAFCSRSQHLASHHHFFLLHNEIINDDRRSTCVRHVARHQHCCQCGTIRWYVCSTGNIWIYRIDSNGSIVRNDGLR